jgi:hypothetical protein
VRRAVVLFVPTFLDNVAEKFESSTLESVRRESGSRWVLAIFHTSLCGKRLSLCEKSDMFFGSCRCSLVRVPT